MRELDPWSTSRHVGEIAFLFQPTHQLNWVLWQEPMLELHRSWYLIFICFNCLNMAAATSVRTSKPIPKHDFSKRCNYDILTQLLLNMRFHCGCCFVFHSCLGAQPDGHPEKPLLPKSAKWEIKSRWQQKKRCSHYIGLFSRVLSVSPLAHPQIFSQFFCLEDEICHSCLFIVLFCSVAFYCDLKRKYY